MRSEHRAEKTLLLLLIVKSAAVPITAIHAVDRWGKWPLILARPPELELATSVVGSLLGTRVSGAAYGVWGAAGAGIF